MKIHSKESIQRQQKKQAKLKIKRAKKRAALKLERQEQKRNIVYQMYKIIKRFFPELFDWMREIEDCRRKPEYELAAIITACIVVFLFKAGSRNELNNMRDDPKFCKNYEKIFKLELPHLDTVDRMMRKLEGAVLEELKRRMIQVLLNRKSLHKYRLQNKWFQVAIDGTGHSSSDHCHCEHCLHRTSKNDKTTWFHSVLEAKLITINGFALSIGTEWIENPEGDYEKQDCERKAFIRLTEKLKKDYPRLPMCITADGLYPYQGFFDICQANSWCYIVSFKDGCLPSVWEEVRNLKPQQNENQRQTSKIKSNKTIKYNHIWVKDIDYNGHITHWIECLEIISECGKDNTSTRFAVLTDLKPDYHSVSDLSFAGRLRWKIENEGFNTQKNHGYGLKHKFARKSYIAMKNYYQCLQIAHIINELLVLSENFQALLVGKMTIKHIWKYLQGLMCYGDVDEDEINKINAERCQIRFVT